MIAGKANLSESAKKNLTPGSYFSSIEKARFRISSELGDDCIIYVRSKGKFKVIAGS